MANKTIAMSKLRRLIQLHTQGKSKLFISRYLDLSRNTVDKYLAQYKLMGLSLEDVEKLTDIDLDKLFFIRAQEELPPRIKALHSFFPYMEKELKKTGVTRQLMWEEYIAKHPGGVKRSQFNELYSQSEVEIYHRYERIAVHKRNRHLFGHTTITDHLASQHRFMSDWNPDKFIERAAEVGPQTKEYIIQLLNARQHPEQTYRSCQGVLSFSVRAGKERLNNACLRALQYGDYSYQTIRVILEKGLDRNVDDQQHVDQSMPPHLNIRGKNYYR